MNALTLPARPTGQRRLLLLVVALLALPFVVAAGLYFAGWRPDRTVNHGELLNPPLPLATTDWRAAPGEAPPAGRIAGYWALVLVLPDGCPDQCLARLDELRRIQVSMNKDMGRLKRVALATDGLPPALLELGKTQPDLIVAEVPPGALPPGVHIVDPQGRRVMTFTVDAPGRDIRTDLARLLKFAWNG